MWSGEEPEAACQVGRAALHPLSLTVPHRGSLASPIPGQATGMPSSLHHCPLAAFPGPRWRAAPIPRILICGPGWHLPWPPPRSGACWPAPWGDLPPRWSAVLCMFTEAAGLGSGCFLGLQALLPNHKFSSPLSEQGRDQPPRGPRQPWGQEGPGGGWGQACPFSAWCPSC